MRSLRRKGGFLHKLRLAYGVFGLLLVQTSVHALASPFNLHRRESQSLPSHKIPLWRIRGGQQAKPDTKPSSLGSSLTSKQSSPSTLNGVSAMFASIGKSYGSALGSHPILTKSVTACAIFGLSDYFAQKMENRNQSKKEAIKYNWTRTLTSMAVGLLYFGPAAHAWYDMIFRVFPGTGLLSTLQKAAMGQMFFGPSFTCIFFATSLLQSGQFTMGNWLRKIRRDLPGAWLAGAGFWPLVDLVSYSFILVQYIPLFVNICSFVWTIYLSIIANRSASS